MKLKAVEDFYTRKWFTGIHSTFVIILKIYSKVYLNNCNQYLN